VPLGRALKWGDKKMRMRKYGASPCIALAVVLSGALAAGCSSHTGGGADSALTRLQETNITVAAIPTNDLAGLYIAQDDGLFSKQGLHVTIEKIASSRAVIAEQLAGRVDISAGSYVAYIAAQATGARFRILAEASTLKPGARMLVVTAASHITSLAGLAGKKIAVNGTNSIGTLLVSALLEENEISPGKAHFITDPAGFPAMPGHLQAGGWGAAFLAEPYVTIAEQNYGDQELADLDQGATEDFPIDGYVATQAWAEQHPKATAAFERAIQEGQVIADTDRKAVQTAIGESDDLPPVVTAVMALPGFPTGPVDAQNIQRVAELMLEFGVLGRQYRAEVEQGTLTRSMISGEAGPASLPPRRSASGGVLRSPASVGRTGTTSYFPTGNKGSCLVWWHHRAPCPPTLPPSA
jgi:NitT/TauT family transport system substrate-binding protein